jgi:hypothetical protein
MVMKNRWEVKWWRVGLALLIIFASLFAVEFVWEQYADWQEIRAFCRENPNLADVPVPLPDKSVATLDGARLEFPGLSLRVPWKDIWRRWDAQSLTFKDGPVFRIPTRDASALEKVIQNYAKTKQEADAGRRLVGSQSLNCCYDLMASELTVTPSELRWWNTWPTRRRVVVRLDSKLMDIMKANAIYEISAGEMHGFQMGNPALAPYEVTLELFDRNDLRHEITMSKYRADRPFVTQAEVNAIVASIRLIPATQAPPK